ncbi:N-acetylglucosamine-6-phosphate deacetylase [Lyngbya aestuarii BL J]|uniref:N-acetylglucosamine-6-phosphate deacetylase n=1 Tax=Lyngbya aestuarii BL J TaxID=1348334 RepID=U7QIG5_9CYAN|nr:N-acetylglucosamine-6-phosphate deacetylase [Lyngbya aestuarii]ERT06216.1 N-acetylglucosamine-6-phosphate deacetylase [Lyngbya aestuarii BL J]
MTQTATQTAASIDIINARLPGDDNLQQILIRQGKIAAIQAHNTQNSDDFPCLDLEGDWVSLGGIDLQINGALGLAFPEVTPQDYLKLHEICQYLWNQGVDGFLPTIVTTTLEQFQRSLATFAEFMQTPASANTAQILGVHLEGPFLNAEKRGAHPQDCLLPLTLDNVKRVLGDYADIVKIITLAPELDPTGKVIPFLRNLGITVSLGHSQATVEQANLAFSQGATMVTHAFNAMPSLHHRQPGLLGAALVHPNVHCGLIADGQHVSPPMIQVLLQSARGKLETSGKIADVFLVSDALSPLGLADGVYPWDQRQIEVRQGTARLLDGTLAGTTHPLLVGVQNLVKWGVCSVSEAIALATHAPREARAISGMINSPATELIRWTEHPELTLSWERLFPNLSKSTL